MRQLSALIISCLLAVPSWGAIGATAVWEVRSTGSDTNGGGYTSGGTDWSQQDAAQYAVTDAVTAGTTTITSATASFGTDVVGNVCYVTGGTGSITAGWYQVASRTNATTIVVDRSTGLTTGTGATLNCGGGLATPAKANAVVVAGNTVYVKAATYTTAATLTLTAGSAALPIQWVGYTTTRTDSGLWTFQSTNNAANPVLSMSNYNRVSNITVDGNSKTGRGIAANGIESLLYNCEIKNVAGADLVLYVASFTEISYCYIHANTATTNATVYLNSGQFTNSTVLSNTLASGARSVRMVSRGITTRRSIIASNTAVSGTVIGGIYCDNTCEIVNNSIYANAGNGIEVGTAEPGAWAFNNILVSNTGFGIAANGAVSATMGDYNALYNNTNGAYSNVTAGPNDITLTGVPFTNAGGGDYSLNNTASQGAACRAAGFSPLMPGLSSTHSYLDIGAVQHQDSGSGASQHNSAFVQ